MLTQSVSMIDRLRVSDLKRFNARKLVSVPQLPSLRELLITAGVTLVIASFGFITFLGIPVMGQVTIGFALFLAVLHLFYRSLALVALTALSCAAVAWTALFLSIKGIKNNREVLLFFWTATGIPVAAMCCMFIGARIWSIQGGVE
ncbi:MAG: hypothetical protein ACK5GN_13250 [Pseudomonadota bacterium]